MPKPDHWYLVKDHVYEIARFGDTFDAKEFDKVEAMYSEETIRQAAESYCDYLDHISKDELTDEEKEQRQAVKNEIRRFAKKISEVSFGETDNE